MAVVQPRYIDFPFHTWALHPVGDHTALYTLKTTRFHVEIKVTGNMCRLVSPSLPELSRQLSTDLKPGQLLLELAAAGLNLMPLQEDAALITEGTVTPKHPRFETQVYRDVSMLAAAFSVASSRWNQPAGSDVAILRVKETLEWELAPEDVHETDWRTLRYVHDPEAGSGFRVGLAHVTESAKEFVVTEQLEHCTARRSIAARSTPEALELALDSNPVFQTTVQTLLQLTRPLSFH